MRHSLRHRVMMVLAGVSVVSFIGTLLLWESLDSSSYQYAPKRIVVTTAMIGEPLRKIGAGRVEIITLMKEGVDPHLYRPTRTDIAELAKADIIIWTGPSLEAPLRRPIMRFKAHKKVITLLEEVPERALRIGEAGHIDPHIWMDPLLWSDALARAVHKITDADLDNAAFYLARLRIFQRNLGRLHESIARSMNSIPDKARILLTAHDAFFYFGRRYNLEVRGIQGMSTESEAGLHDINQLVRLTVERQIPALFAESSVNPKYLDAVIEGAHAEGHELVLGGMLFADSMGAAGTRASSYAGMLAHNARVIAHAFNKEDMPSLASDKQILQAQHEDDRDEQSVVTLTSDNER